jgi:hypothetical protein
MVSLKLFTLALAACRAVSAQIDLPEGLEVKIATQEQILQNFI